MRSLHIKALWTSFALPLLIAAQTAHGHAQLEVSIPADQAVLASAPAEIVLEFSEEVRLAAVSIEKDGGSGEDLESLPDDTKARFAVAAPELSAGRYTVTWRAMSADTHVLSGEIEFIVEETSGRSD